MTVKDALYAHCVGHVLQRLARIKDEIANLQASANSETKSSAGDKYETGRAMAQLEVEGSRHQLRDAEKSLAILKSIEVAKVVNMVLPGSMVATSHGIYYIAISLGLVTHEGKPYFIVSPDSPIGKLLMGKQAGNTVFWKEKEYIIQSIT